MKKIIFIFIIISYTGLYSQTEFIVNTYKDSTQSQPVIESIDAEDNIAVVWKSFNQAGENSEGDIYLKFFTPDLNPSGDEFLVNDNSDGPQETPVIASNNNGSFIVAWASFDRGNFQNFFDIKAKLFENMSAKTFEFTVNSHLENSQIRPSVDMNQDGEFIIVWESWYQDGNDRGVYAQLFDSEGNKKGNEFLVNTTTQYSQARPTVEFFDDGKFIIVWESWIESEMGYNLFGKIFDSSGSVVKEEFMINSYTDNYQWMGDVAAYSDNSFDVVWCSWEQDGYDGGIYLRSYDNSFEPIGDELLINSSTEFYQWLPKIRKHSDGKKAVIWSSWNQDGSREGVYYKTLSKSNKVLSLEKRLNENTESFQWEPDLTILSTGEFVGTWSSWGEVQKDYEIIIKKFKPELLIGKLDEESYIHTAGISTSNFIVHVIDSTQFNGHLYEITFDEYDVDALSFSIMDLSAAEEKVIDFPLDRGTNTQYLTEQFDGIIIEIIPNFDLDIDLENSKFVTNSGTNVTFTLEKPVIYPTIAPLDVAVIWGNPDTLSDGRFVEPLDTALTPSNVREIELPFFAKTIEENEKLRAVVFENTSTANKRWDPGENIVFLTPEEYRTNAFSTHVQLFSNIDDPGNIIWPNAGDTNFIATIRPITIDDVYQFTTQISDIILDLMNIEIPERIQLSQNYPNPFNPSTKINYDVPSNSVIASELNVRSNLSSDGKIQQITSSQAPHNDNANVSLVVYDILGRVVAILVNEKQKPGNYSIEFNASHLSSGVYFYHLEVDNVHISKKMLLLK